MYEIIPEQQSILVVDDNPDNLKVLTNILDEEGYATRVALNGELAIKSVATEIPDLVLLDIQMPKMDGYETCKHLKGNNNYKNIPVIFLTAMNEVFNKKKAFTEGAVDYITKPFEREELLARVKTHLTLRQSRLELEKFNADIYARLMKSLKEKDVLIRELYHRTKNNMQVITSILGLYALGLDDPAVTRVFKSIENRIYSMALVHEQLFKSKDLSHINIKILMEKLVSLLVSNFPVDLNNITLETDVKDFVLIIDYAVPCGLIMYELLSNSLKYAFPDNRKGTITIHMSMNDNNTVFISYSDDGIGIASGSPEQNSTMLGLMIMETIITEQLKGSLNVTHNNGIHYTIQFNTEIYTKRV